MESGRECFRVLFFCVKMKKNYKYNDKNVTEFKNVNSYE